MRLSGKIAVITGAGSGIGKAAVLLFLREGACVVAASCEPDVHRLADDAAEHGVRLVTLCANVCDEDQIQALIRTAVHRFGGLDILFNNAGIEISRPATETSMEDWQRLFDANARGTFLCCKHAIPAMLQRGGGAIVNNASINGIRGNYSLAAYSASKGAVLAMTRSLALEFAHKNIRANSICAGTIEDTGLVQRRLAAAPDPEELYQALVAKHPLGRLGRANEVANAALFLASDEASFITGATLPVDGGRSIR